MKADATCCLTDINVIKRPCIVLRDRDRLMGKKVEASGFKVCAGRSIVETMEDRLDYLITQLMTGTAADPEFTKAHALGVAECIALIRTPYAPDVDLVREQAMARYEDSARMD